MADTPQFELPFRLDAGEKAVLEVEQDSIDEIAGSVEALLRTPIGWYEDQPGYGVAEHTFDEGDISFSEIQTAITIWEPRADVILDAEPDRLDAMVRNINLNVTGRSDG
jgi:phage baseplate assembly protein W